MSRSVLVPAARVPRWVANFGVRHGRTELSVIDGVLRAVGEDGERADLALPFDRKYEGAADPAGFAAAMSPPDEWAVILARKGGFAVARLAGDQVTASKVGGRHVQGRTKAGGQSQQRFARRRDNQARQAYEAAADHAARLLGEAALMALVCGGDRRAVDEVLADDRLVGVREVRCGTWLPVPDPRRAVLDQAILDAQSSVVTLFDH